MRDVTAAYASRESFDEVLEKMKTAHDDKVEGSPQSAVEAMGKVLALTEKGYRQPDGRLACHYRAGGLCRSAGYPCHHGERGDGGSASGGRG